MKIPPEHLRVAAKKRREAAGDTGKPGAKRARPRSPAPPPRRHQVAREKTAPAVEARAEAAPTAERRGEEARVEVVPRRGEEAPTVARPRGRENPAIAEPAVEEAVPEAEGVAALKAPDSAPDATVASRPAVVAHPEALPLRKSIMNHDCLAERLLGRVCLPHFREELCQQRATEVFDDLYMTMLWTVNGVFAVWDVCLRAADNVSLARRETTTARVQAKKAEGELESAWAREAARVEELQAAKDENCEWEARFEEAKRKAAGEFERAWIAEAKLADAMARLENFEHRLEVANSKVDETEE